MGAVYEARDRVNGERVAVKVLEQAEARGAAATRTRFFREAHASMGLTDPHIIRVFDVAVDDALGLPFMVMEYLDGEDLAQLLTRIPVLPSDIALRVIAQAAAGVETAHAARVVHRDIKPANLFLARDREERVTVKVLDFGIAKAAIDVPAGELPTLTRTGHLMGSPLYMSPEQARSSRNLDHRTDVWSLGIVLYRMLSGRAPLEECESLGDFIISICATPPRPVRELAPWVSEEIAAVLDRALRIDPAERPASARSLREQLLTLLPGGDDSLDEAAIAPPPSDLFGGIRPVFPGREETMAVRETFIVGDPIPTSAPRVRPTLAVLGFKNLTGRAETAWLSTAFSEMLLADVAAGEQVRTLAGEEVARLLTDMGVGPDDKIDGEIARRVGEKIGADYLVGGSYLAMSRPEGLQIMLAAKLHESGTGQGIATFSETAADVDMISLVARVSAKLCARMGAVSPEVPEVSAPPLPREPKALQFYAEGLDRLRHLDLGAARDLLERAVAASPDHPLPHAALADVWIALGYDDRASEAARAASERSRALRREDRLFIEGRFHEACKSWDAAVESFRTLFEFFPDDVEYGLRLARAQTNAGKGKDALATIARLRRLPPPACEDVRIDLAEAAAASSLSDYARELSAALKAEAGARAKGVRLPLAKARFSQGNALVRLGRPADAVAPCREARQLFADAGDRAGEALALNRIANLVHEAGDLPEAEKLFREALQIWEDVGHGAGRALALNNVADTVLMQGRLRDAEPLFRDALTVAVEGGDSQHAILARINLADLLTRSGRLAKARELVLQAESDARATGFGYGLAVALFVLGTMAHLTGEIRDGERWLEEGLTLASSLRDRRFAAFTLYALGDLRHVQGELGEARRLHQDALAIRREIHCFMDVAESELQLAHLALDDGHLESADEMISRARAQFTASGMLENNMYAMAAALEVALAKDDWDAARAEMDALRPKLAGLENVVFRLVGSLAVARAEGAFGDVEAARARAEAARVEAAMLGLRRIELEAELVVVLLDAIAGRGEDVIARRSKIESAAAELGLELLRRHASLEKQPG